ncbi:MAG TPA: urate hydroxylase PuuD [Vicinamibacterales bacterium]|nr:urate hydroxylase PuuD [Vicinamibacterales bacterium]
MDYTLSEWLNLIVRWVHVFAAILWVGTTYYFTWLDGQLRRAAGDGGARVWMVHSGGFYTVERQSGLGVPAGNLHWFRWEAMTTWVSGLALLVLVYYAGGLTVDAATGPRTEATAIAAGIASLAAGWFVYDALAQSRLAARDLGFAAVAFTLILLDMLVLGRMLSARATYMHVGALFGTIMALNVWVRILPPQRRMVAAASRGDALDPALGAGAKHRSRHNTFLAVPTAFIMVSSHFPVATYGHRHGLWILAGLILAGWGAASMLRRA